MHGSGALIRWLLDHDRVDEIQLLVVPLVLGQGAPLFPEAGPDITLDLIDSRADSNGVTIQVYRPTGRPQYSSSNPTAPVVRERCSREPSRNDDRDPCAGPDLGC